jgi:hypothetical protein
MSAPNRIDLLQLSNSLVGIDFIRVSADQRELAVFLHHKSPLPAGLLNTLNALKPEQIQISPESSSTLPIVMVQSPLPAVGIESGRRFLRIPVLHPGGFGTYRLTINHPALDPFFNQRVFSFKAGCPSDLDCAEAAAPCPSPDGEDFPVDYRARDFWSFRQALLDFASQRYPHWQDRLEADVGMVMVEVLSALGDEFSYAQDRLAREVHLDTASQRRSLRHHARLVDYALDDGSGATAWLDVTALMAGTLPGGTAVGDANAQAVFEIGHGLRDEGKPFPVSPLRNAMEPYLWDEEALCLPKGSSMLTLVGHLKSHFSPIDAIDPEGKWILLATEPTSPDQPERRFMARVPVGGAIEGTDPLTATAITDIHFTPPTPFDLDLTVLRVRGNLLPSVSGRTLDASFCIGPDGSSPSALERVGGNGSLSYESALPGPLSPRVKFLYSLPQSEKTPLVWLPVPGAPGAYRPEIQVTRDPGEPWSWLPELVGEETAAPTAKAFTLEDGTFATVFAVDRNGERYAFQDYASNEGTTLRFGDGEFGLSPSEGSLFHVRYRLGNGSLMNVAPQTLNTFVLGLPACVASVTNPMAAEGGRDPESAESARMNAPEAFRAKPYRAVRPEDFDEISRRELPWIQRSGAVMRWTGSWPAVFVTPDPLEAVGLTPERRQEHERLVERIRQAGRDVRVMDPRYVSIDLRLRVCVSPRAYQGEVEAALLRSLFGDGNAKGFFHPDHFTFGTPLSRAALLAHVQSVPGVCSVEDIWIRRRGVFPWRPFLEFQLAVRKDEVLQVANNPMLPERGQVQLVMEGGA